MGSFDKDGLLTGVSGNSKIYTNERDYPMENCAVLSGKEFAMKKHPQGQYYVGIYVRLSRDDNNSTSESMSIQNQIALLTAHAQNEGWHIVKVYSDDGYSGTTFDRPDFKELIRDIEFGKINLVLTKDLSRLGRNYIMTGQYTDYYFPEHGVRYVALGDNYDSVNVDNDIAPFKMF